MPDSKVDYVEDIRKLVETPTLDAYEEALTKLVSQNESQLGTMEKELANAKTQLDLAVLKTAHAFQSLQVSNMKHILEHLIRVRKAQNI